MQNQFWKFGVAGSAAVLGVLLLVGFGVTPVSAAEGESLSLQDALRLAESQAPGVEAAEREVAQAQSAYRELKGGYLPQVTLNGGVEGSETLGSEESDFAFGDPGASLDVGITVPLTELIGAPSAARERAEYDVQAATRALEQAREDAKLAALEGYIGVLKAETQLDLSRRSVEKMERLVEQTRLRYNLGEATQLEVMEAEKEQSDGELALAQAENALEEAYATLNQALGRPVDAPIRVAPVAVAPFAWEGGGESVRALSIDVETAFRHRVEVLLAEEQLELFYRTQELTPDPGKPFVTFSAGYDGEDGSIAVRRTTGAAGAGQRDAQIARWELAADGTIESGEDGPSGSVGEPPLGWNAGVGVTWPFFTGGQAKETRRQNELERDALLASIQQARESVRLDVRSHRSALELAYKTLEIREKALAQAQESLRVIRLQHEAGAVTDSDLLDAELSTLQAEFDRDAARYEIWSATARYDRALGLSIFAPVVGASRDEEGAR